jgi:hypothetical protein
MYQLPNAPRANGEVLDSAFKLARTGFVRMLPYAILTSLLSAAPFFYLLNADALADPVAAIGVMFSWRSLLLGLVMIGLGIFINGASIVRIESIAQGADVGIGPSFGATLPRVPALVGGMIGFFLAVTVGFFLLVIPGFYLLGSLFLFVPAIVLDGKGAIESLGHSFQLVLGNWWRLAIIGGIALILLYLLYVVVGVLVGLVMGFRGAELPFVFMVNLVSSLVGGLLTAPFFAALCVEMYREVKMRKQVG